MGASLARGVGTRTFTLFAEVGWAEVFERPLVVVPRTGKRVRARFARLTPSGVEALRVAVARFGTSLGDLSTLPEPAAPGSELERLVLALAQLVRQAFRRSDLSVRKVAELVGRPPSYMAHLMAGDVRRPQPEHIARLAEVLRLSHDEASRAVDLAAQICQIEGPDNLPAVVPRWR